MQPDPTDEPLLDGSADSPASLAAERARRHERSVVLPAFANTMLATVLALAWYIAASTYPNEALNTVPSPGGSQSGLAGPPQQRAPTNVPSWNDTLAAAYPECHAHRDSDRTDVLVVVDQSSTAQKMSLDEAYDRTVNTDAADDVWVVGAC